MPKDKAKPPFGSQPAFGELLKLPKGQVKEKVRKADPAGRSGLLTSNDLFGDILDSFTPGQGGASPGMASGAPASRTVERATPPAPPPPPGPAEPAVRPDTVPVNYPPGQGPPGDEYSLVDLAYTTLLQDEKLNRAIEELGKREANEAEYGQYLLLDRIAVGGMAEVFRAKRKGVEGFEKVVAVKRVLPHLFHNKGFIDMFIDEAKMVAGLSHPNIVQIFELGKVEDTYFIAMEHVDGTDLKTLLSRVRDKEAALDPDLAALVAARVSSALEYAHRYRDSEGRELRIVHRDVSPQNILMSREGEVKLADFGIAKAASKASHTDSGSLRGKLLYMSPEQAWGQPIDKRSDIFSLGVVFFEMLTGRTLFVGDSEMSILERVREALVLPPSALNPGVPIELEAVVNRALRKNPEERYQDAAEMLLHLDSYLRRRPAVGSADLARFVRGYLDPP